MDGWGGWPGPKPEDGSVQSASKAQRDSMRQARRVYAAVTLLGLVRESSAAAAAATFETTSYRHPGQAREYPLDRPGHDRNSGAVCEGTCREAADAPLMEQPIVGAMAVKQSQYDACNNGTGHCCPDHVQTGTGATCINGTATVAGPGGTNIDYDCLGVDLLSSITIADLGLLVGLKGAMGSGDGAVNDNWGWTDPDTGDEIAIVGSTDRVAFVKITDPSIPVVLGTLQQTASDKKIWADVKVFADHAYIVRESEGHGVQIFDLRVLRPYYNGTSSSPLRSFSTTFKYSDFRCHNLVINEESAFGYAVGTSTCSGGLHAFDLADPAVPVFAGCFSADGYTHDAQCVIYAGPDTRYTGSEICFALNEDTVTVVEVSNKSDMVQLGRFEYNSSAYTHQGWLTEDHRHMLVGDELDEIQGKTGDMFTHTLIWDVSNLTNAIRLRDHIGDGGAVDHNLYIKGDRAFLSNYCDGLRVLDITNIAAASVPEIAYFDVAPECDGPGFLGSWSVFPFFDSGSILSTSIYGGLFVLKLAPLAPTPSPSVKTPQLSQTPTTTEPTPGPTQASSSSPTPAPSTSEPSRSPLVSWPPPPPPPTNYCQEGYDDYGVRYTAGVGKIIIVYSHEACSARCTQYSDPRWSGGCKGYQTGMFAGMLFCRAYGWTIRATGCADWAHPSNKGRFSGELGSTNARTTMVNIGGNCCSNITFVEASIAAAR